MYGPIFMSIWKAQVVMVGIGWLFKKKKEEEKLVERVDSGVHVGEVSRDGG